MTGWKRPQPVVRQCSVWIDSNHYCQFCGNYSCGRSPPRRI